MVRSCDSTNTKAYIEMAFRAYGENVKMWHSAVVAEMGHLLGKLPHRSIKELTESQLSLVSPVVFAEVPATFVKVSRIFSFYGYCHIMPHLRQISAVLCILMLHSS